MPQNQENASEVSSPPPSRPVAAEGARAWLGAFFSASTAGMAIVDPDLRYLRVNETLASYNGLSAEAHIGRRLHEVLPGLAPTLEPILQKVIASHRPVLESEIVGETPAQPGRVRRWRVSFFPLPISPDHPPGVGVVAVETTDRYEAEAKLRRQQHLLLEAQQLGRIGSWEWDLVTGSLVWSDEVYRKFGLPPHTPPPSLARVMDFIDPEDRTRINETLQRALADHQPFSFDYRFRRADGSKGIALARGEVDLDAQGRPLRLYGVSQDVTEREHAKTALQRSELLWRSVFSAAHDAILVHDADLQLLACNGAAEQMYGYSLSEFARMNFNDLRATPPPVTTTGASGHPFQVDGAREETIHRRRDGSVFPAETSARSFTLSGELRVVRMVQDITIRKDAERQIRFQVSMLDQVRNAVIATDNTGRITYWNRFAEALYQWSAEEVANRSVFPLLVPPSHAKQADELAAATAKGENWQGELTVQRKDGTTFPAWVVNTPLRDERDALVGMVGVSLNITETKRAEREVTQSREQLRLLATRLDSVREEEARRIAREVHDTLGQQLTALKLDLQYLESSLPKSNKAIARQCIRLHALLDSTIEAAQKISGELRLGHLDVVGLGEAMTWHLRDFERRTGVACRTTDITEVHGLGHTCATTAFRIFQEAVTNVARHAHATAVDFSLYLDGSCLVLRVRDNGRGIAPERLAHPQAIGLLGMRERAQAIGGWLTVETAVGRGTTIIATLPRQPAE